MTRIPVVDNFNSFVYTLVGVVSALLVRDSEAAA